MLKQLTLQNFVLVTTLDIDFNPGLTTITGESGAGKSILLNALGLLLGERARTEVIRPGADKADVCAEFDLTHLPAVQAQLNEAELLSDTPEQVLVRRVVSSQGRSRAFVNGIPVTTTFLKDLGEQLVDIHGQHEHLRLANRNTQLTLLDDYAGLTKTAHEVSTLYRDWQAEMQRIQELEARLASAADRQDLLAYQLQELEEFDLKADEFAVLEQDHKRLSRAHTTLASLQQAVDKLEELDDLRHAVRQIQNIDDEHPDLASGQANLASALGLLDDASRDLRHYQDKVVVDPEAMALIESRLNIAQDLARKHRVEPEDLHSHAAALRADLDALDADGSSLDEMRSHAQKLKGDFDKRAKTLSTRRRKAAPDFGKAVSQFMQSLGINKGEFAIAFEDHTGERGLERAEFMVTTNPSFPAGPLTQIASGGEQTRIGLSIQIVAAQNSALPCLILDEADVGVGGTTADTVGRILRDLGSRTQVICITHAPQVAALGDSHYRVTKKGDNTQIQPLSDDHRIEELARMLAGADITDETREYARTLRGGAIH
ncbi:MAG: DNA repair protein RecN [Pseudomonadaceae bacterium]|nr:DNA repair protein RecN [Pseudomonadaceae bacterium]